MSKPRLLAHICCAPDAAYVLKLLKEKYDVSGYFYNPNIHPTGEYRLRLEEARRVAGVLNFRLVEEVFDEERWMALTRRFRDEPEKGRRCDVCYAIRLQKTAQAAARLGFECFTTIMSLSPWKKADVLNRIGRMFGRRHQVFFLEADFKKKDGFRRSVALSRDMHLYRQSYCGCVYSQKKAKGTSGEPEK
ncbi:MAG: epoxyqueuosine reductase QueH [Acidobacteriota bacterium]